MVYFVDEVYVATLNKDFLYYLLAMSEGWICILFWLDKALYIVESKLGQSTSSDQVLILIHFPLGDKTPNCLLGLC